MDPEPPRQALAISAFAGAAFWGMFHLWTTIWAGQPVARTDVVKAAVNVAMGLLGGVMVAWFLGPAVTPYVPLAGLKDPHVVGFAIGAATWEVAPFVYSWLRARAARTAKEKS